MNMHKFSQNTDKVYTKTVDNNCTGVHYLTSLVGFIYDINDTQ